MATNTLRTAGLRITRPRLAILAALKNRAKPISIEQLHAEVGAETCDLVTVYRCMAAFEEIGLVRRAFFHNGTLMYEISFGQPARYHIVNKETDGVEELDEATTAELRSALVKIEALLKDRGYTQVGHLVEFFGTGPDHTGTRRLPQLPEVR